MMVFPIRIEYAEMEPYLCDVAEMGTIASNLFDVNDFAGHHLEDMLDDLKARYYALDFPP